MADLPFLEEDPTDKAVATEPEVQPEPEPEEVKGEEPSATPPVAVEEPKGIPIQALLDEREKRQKAEREAEELRKWKAQAEAEKSPPPRVDPIEDPEGFIRQQQQAVAQAVLADRLARSRYMAEKAHGAEFVQEVVAFYNDPRHAPKSHEFLSHPDPMDAAIAYYRQQQDVARLQEVGGLEAFRAKLEAEIREKLLAEAVQPKSQATPPPSLSAAQSSGAGKAPVASPFAATFGD